MYGPYINYVTQLFIVLDPPSPYITHCNALRDLLLPYRVMLYEKIMYLICTKTNKTNYFKQSVYNM